MKLVNLLIALVAVATIKSVSVGYNWAPAASYSYAPAVSYDWAPASYSYSNWAPASYTYNNCGSYGYQPVCGVNNVTYMNACACRRASVRVRYQKACTTTATKTYTLAGNGYYW